jgi:hypothetical protein
MSKIEMEVRSCWERCREAAEDAHQEGAQVTAIWSSFVFTNCYVSLTLLTITLA